MECFNSKELSIYKYLAFPDINYMNLNYEQDLTGKHFYKRNYTGYTYHDYLVKPMLKLLFETENFA